MHLHHGERVEVAVEVVEEEESVMPGAEETVGGAAAADSSTPEEPTPHQERQARQTEEDVDEETDAVAEVEGATDKDEGHEDWALHGAG